MTDEIEIENKNVDQEEVIEEVLDIVSMLPKSVQQRVEKLKQWNDEREDILEEYMKDRVLLEKKYGDRFKMLYDFRRDVIAGEMDDAIAEEYKKLKEDEIDDGIDDDVVDNDDEIENDDKNDSNLKGIPEFWICAMNNFNILSEHLTERDNLCLLHLKDVSCHDFDDGTGFELRFSFDEKKNPFFSNQVLVKRYEVPNLLLDEEPILKHVEGRTIEWKSDDMCLTQQQVVKKQRSVSGQNAGQVRTVSKMERCDSFFHFFSPPTMPSVSNMNEEEVNQIEEEFELDFDIAQAFRTHLIPKAVSWFTGEAIDEEIVDYVEETH
eukprot:CAMPEP_0184855806 /NCGR_PEP_ID=MMETSP0580-20130426/951_1 /TAXON_ID=1118495 /ORGANISM="Dactyliosolen fragilissimus" /LENGTH=321 /DNA_ID=CAMNT_0027350429 /DNA_START=45 /DNA_END=1010 /DNA_ORIENTATION=+